MSEYVADTHALYWHLKLDQRLSPSARQIFVDADNGLHRIYVPSIVLVEMTYLVERGRLSPEPIEWLLASSATIDGAYQIADLHRGTAITLRRVPRTAVPDMPDRIITATALHLGLPLITADQAIRGSGVVQTIW